MGSVILRLCQRLANTATLVAILQVIRTVIDMERTIDVLVIGGGAAGSAAALQLARVRRGVVVIDSGEPRNAPAAHMQGYLGHDGLPPAEFTAIAHAEPSSSSRNARAERSRASARATSIWVYAESARVRFEN